MKKTIIIFFLLIINFTFSQSLKAVSIQDSLSVKYPDRKKMDSEIGKIYLKSEISQKAVADLIKKKLSIYDPRKLKRKDVDLAITYYRVHYLWIFIDQTLTNFTDSEINQIESEISDKNADNVLIQKFRDIEKKVIGKFQKEF